MPVPSSKSASVTICAALPAPMRDSIVSAYPDTCVLPHAPDSDPVLECCRAHPGAVLIVDQAALPTAGTLRVASALARVHVLAISDDLAVPMLRRAFTAGCSGVLLTGAHVEMQQSAITAVLRGELWYPRAMLSQLARGARLHSARQRLTARELEILTLLGADHKNQAIADRLSISRDTVRWHLRALYTKIGVTSREEAQEFARSIGADHAGESADRARLPRGA